MRRPGHFNLIIPRKTPRNRTLAGVRLMAAARRRPARRGHPRRERCAAGRARGASLAICDRRTAMSGERMLRLAAGSPRWCEEHELTPRSPRRGKRIVTVIVCRAMLSSTIACCTRPMTDDGITHPLGAGSTSPQGNGSDPRVDPLDWRSGSSRLSSLGAILLVQPGRGSGRPRSSTSPLQRRRPRFSRAGRRASLMHAHLISFRRPSDLSSLTLGSNADHARNSRTRRARPTLLSGALSRPVVRIARGDERHAVTARDQVTEEPSRHAAAPPGRPSEAGIGCGLRGRGDNPRTCSSKGG